MNLQIKRGGGVEARAFTEKNKIKKPTKYAVFCCRCKTVAFKFVRDQTENLKLGHLATVLCFFVVQTYGEGKKTCYSKPRISWNTYTVLLLYARIV